MRSRYRSYLALLAAGAFAMSAASAQDVFFYAPHGGPPVKVDPNNPGPYAQAKSPTKVLKGGNLNFNISYEDVNTGTGDGFDDPAEGATRQAALDAVLLYVEDVLNESSGATLDINVADSQDDGTGFLATAGTFFFDNAAFSNGFAFEHITTGTDPLGGTGDMNITVDFGHSWNSDHTATPGSGEFDLFTVLLHEVTHGLGFLSLSNSDGLSTIHGQMESPKNPGKYAIWDQLMRFNTNTVVWNQTTTVLEVATSVFTSDNLSFSGAQATAQFGSQPPVFAPASFQPGSSLAHYKDGAVTSIMTSSVAPTVVQREYFDIDLATLIDLGYTNASVMPAVSFSLSNYTVNESAGTATITVNLTGTIGSNQTVDYATSAGSATNGDDYNDTSGTLTFMPVDDSLTFDVTIINDTDAEMTETVSLTLSNPSAGVELGSISSATLNINDNDQPATGVEVTTQSGTTFTEETDTLTLNAEFSGLTPPVTYQWEFEGAPLSDGGDVSGATATTLQIENVDNSREGTYVLRGTDASKGTFASDPIFVDVVPAGSLPAAGMLGLGLLAGALAVIGVMFMRRRS